MTGKQWFQLLGSAILISIACLDPGNLLGDIEIAQEMHYKSIWVLFLSHILLFFVQELAFTVSAHSEKDLAQLIRLNYTKKMKIFLWITSEIAIISADIQEILGAVIALKLLTGCPTNWGIPIIIIIVILILFVQELGQKIFELCFVLMVGVLGICCYVNFALSKPRFEDIAWGFVPNLPGSWKFAAVIGAIIMPQNIFLHSSLVHTRSHVKVRKSQLLKVFKIETLVILAISFLINLSLVGLFSDPKFEDKTITLENAGDYIADFLPSVSKYFWAFGLLASGISSTSTGALTGQYIMNGIFNFKFSRIKRSLITRLITIVPCYIIIAAVNVDKIMNMLNIIQFVQLPFVIIPLLKFSYSKTIMKNIVYSNGKLIFLCILFSFLQFVNIYSIISSFQDFSTIWVVFGYVFLVLYSGFCLYLIFMKIKNEVYDEDELKSGIDQENLMDKTSLSEKKKIMDNNL